MQHAVSIPADVRVRRNIDCAPDPPKEKLGKLRKVEVSFEGLRRGYYVPPHPGAVQPVRSLFYINSYTLVTSAEYKEACKRAVKAVLHARLAFCRTLYSPFRLQLHRRSIMVEQQSERLDNGLPKINRFITTHNGEAKAAFLNEIDEELPFQELSDGARFCLGYATNTVPAQFAQDNDVRTYTQYLKDKPGVMIPNGTVCRIVDMRPGALSPMHRTVSLDYGVVLEGAVELVLDSGETRLMRRGDIAVQRGTNHAWRNASQDSWARMLYVLVEAEPLVVDGKSLDEDYGGIPDVRPSRRL